jgi:hypothetical protein
LAKPYKKQQMQWSKKGSHRLLQTQSLTLDGTLHDLFTTWYPAMPANQVSPPHSPPWPELPHGFWCSRLQTLCPSDCRADADPEPVRGVPG